MRSAGEIVFSFSVAQRAIAGERVLLAAGVGTRVMSLPSRLGEGCGICLRVDAGDRERALAVLTGAGAEPEGVYQKIGEGGGVEYRPLSPGAGDA